MASFTRRTALAAGALTMLTACSGDPAPECLAGPAEDSPEGRGSAGGGADADPMEGTVLSDLGLALSPDGTRLIANQARDRLLLELSETSGTTVWDTGSGEILTRFDNGLTGALAWRPDGQQLALGGRTTIDLTTPDGEVQWHLSGHGEPGSGAARIRDLAYSPDGGTLASLGSDGAVHLWSTAAQQCAPARRISVRGLEALSLAWSADGGTLAVCGPGGALELWDPASGERRSRLTALDGDPYGVAFDGEGFLLVGMAEPTGLLVLAADDGSGGSAAAGPAPLSKRPWEIAVAPDGRVAVGGEHDNQVMIWERETDERLDLPRVPGSVGRLCWSPDGRTLYGASQGEGVVRWDGGDWQALETP